MNAWRLLVAGMMVGILTVSAGAEEKKAKPDNAKLLVGKWEVTKCDDGELPVGSVMELTKDGKMKVTVKQGGKEQSINAMYKVEGESLQFTLKQADKEEKKDPITIKKVSDQEMILQPPKVAAVTFKRIK
jgi:uncharacterized protein (TIGR03066 family)